MKGYLIDDEQAPRLILKHLLQRLEPKVEIVGEASSLEEGVEELKSKAIDVLFLDIEMPKYKGLDIDKFMKSPLPFEIVFVTAYSQYAIQAFKLSAFDYLLKPVNRKDLEACLARLIVKKDQHRQRIHGLEVLRKNLSENEQHQYLLRTHKEELLINVEDIINLEADGMYTDIVLKNDRITASKPMKEILADLPNTFYRTHRSYAVNLMQVEIPVRVSTAGIKTRVGSFVPLSNRNKQAFLEHMGVES